MKTPLETIRKIVNDAQGAAKTGSQIRLAEIILELAERIEKLEKKI